MSDIKFHRITDCNGSIDGLSKHTSFEAGFSMSEDCKGISGNYVPGSRPDGKEDE